MHFITENFAPCFDPLFKFLLLCWAQLWQGL
ncbi:Uncharacterised protein [Vibrio cholerae]|nr:Uncharacterised protein [Vibrio cholerae]